MIVSMKINNSTIKKKKKLKYSLLQQQFICTWYLMELCLHCPKESAQT